MVLSVWRDALVAQRYKMPLINSTEEGNIIMWMFGAFENFSFHSGVLQELKIQIEAATKKRHEIVDMVEEYRGQIIINMYSNSFSHCLNNPSSPRFDRNVLFAEIQQQSDIHVELIRVLVQISIDSICHIYLLLLNGLHIHRTRHLLHHFPQFCLEVDFVMVFLSQQRFQIGQINKILIFFHFCFPEFIVEHICASVVFINITIAIILRFESPKCFDKPSPVMTCSQCLGVVISNEQVVASFKLISYLLNFGRASHRKNSVSQASQFLSLFELGHII